jgi:serine O-acetyltransferase
MTDETPSLWTLLREDFAAHERDWTRPGFQAIAVYRFGVARMRVQSRVARGPLSVLYRALYRTVRNVYGIELPYTAQVGRRVVFEHQHGIVVHGNSVIGDDCVLRQGVTLGNRHLDAPAEAPVLGHGVNVGAGAKVLGQVHVGDGASIGANAVVLRDVPAGGLAVGVPAVVRLPGARIPALAPPPAPAAGELPSSGDAGTGESRDLLDTQARRASE